MNVVVNHIPLKAPIDDAVVQGIENDLKPKMLEFGGIQAFYLVKVSDTEGIVIVVYDSPTALQEGTQQVGSPWFEKNIGPKLSGAPSRTVGEVIAHFQK